MGDVKLLRHRETWAKKRCLRLVYSSWYRRILRHLVSGPTVELGAGSGNFKESCPRVVSSDLACEPWLDAAFDAHRMPFPNGRLGNLVLVDVLHHLSSPAGFLREAARVLRPGGRLILLEPYPSPLARRVFARTHPEPFLMDADPFNDGMAAFDTPKDPWQANQAIAWLMFFRHIVRFRQRFGDRFLILRRTRQDCLAYPATGGFEHDALLPTVIFPLLLALEYPLAPLRRLCAFRCFVVLQRVGSETEVS
jgi:SAM-dependent methyltransferase